MKTRQKSEIITLISQAFGENDKLNHEMLENPMKPEYWEKLCVNRLNLIVKTADEIERIVDTP